MQMFSSAYFKLLNEYLNTGGRFPFASNGSPMGPRSFSLIAKTTESRFSFGRMLRHIGHEKYSLFEDNQPEYNDVQILQSGQFGIPKTSSEKMAVATLPVDTISRGCHFSSEVSITPVLMLRGTPEFRAMDMSKRKCLYPDEKKLSLSEDYSQANCYLECAWRKAIETCRCVPWFMKEKHPEIDMCDQFGNICFKNTLDARYESDDETCATQCPNECENLEFEVSLNVRKQVYPMPDCISGE